MAVFDCCREQLTSIAPTSGHDDSNNIFVTYGCPPGGDLDLKSNLATQYAKCIRNNLKRGKLDVLKVLSNFKVDYMK